jgi:RimJ/RimL family protein N-acetyltransferase
MLETHRLRLRDWHEADLEPFAALCADPVVMEHFPSTLTLEQSAEFVDRIRQHFSKNGWGFWAVECPAGPDFIGFVGLARVRFESHFTPAVELGWRLARKFWGQGYASEAARAALAYGFEDLDLPEIISFTVPANNRSWRVMERIGMQRSESEDFDHPAVASGDPLARHILYRIRAADWRKQERNGGD